MMNNDFILAIDPGTTESGWVVVDNNLKPLSFGKTENEKLKKYLDEVSVSNIVIERVSSYGSRVGADVFLTCEWIGRFTEASPVPCYYLRRKDVKRLLGLPQRASDTDIRRYLVKRFARSERNHGKGTKMSPDWFYGFFADVWQAYALAVAWCDTVGVCSHGTSRAS